MTLEDGNLKLQFITHFLSKCLKEIFNGVKKKSVRTSCFRIYFVQHANLFYRFLKSILWKLEMIDIFIIRKIAKIYTFTFILVNPGLFSKKGHINNSTCEVFVFVKQSYFEIE